MQWDANSIIDKGLMVASMPVKLYNFKSTPLAFPDYRSTGQYLLDVLAAYPNIAADATFAVGITWADENPDGTLAKALDIKTYRLGKKWDSNPLVENGNYRELAERPKNPKTGLAETECGTGQIVFAAEEILRRNISVVGLGTQSDMDRFQASLDRYLQEWPDFDVYRKGLETLDSRMGKPWTSTALKV